MRHGIKDWRWSRIQFDRGHRELRPSLEHVRYRWSWSGMQSYANQAVARHCKRRGLQSFGDTGSPMQWPDTARHEDYSLLVTLAHEFLLILMKINMSIYIYIILQKDCYTETLEFCD